MADFPFISPSFLRHHTTGTFISSFSCRDQLVGGRANDRSIAAGFARCIIYIIPSDWQNATYLAVGLLLYVYLGMIIRDTLEIAPAGVVGLVICCILVDAALLAVAQNILGIQT